MRGSAAILASAAWLVACGHSERHEVVFRVAPRTGRPVEVYMVGEQPPRPFDELALLQVVSTGDQAEPGAVLAALSRRAVELGCDAVVRVRVDVGITAAHGYAVCVRTQDARTSPP